jgi:hypothetical protein
MPSPRKTPVGQKEWDFGELLKSAKLAEVRFCHRYEFGREALDYISCLAAHSEFSLGEVAVLLEHLNISLKFSFYTYYFRAFKKGVWLKVPYFELPREFRAMVQESETARLSTLIDPLYKLDRGPVKDIDLVIPLNASRTILCECFAAYLEVHFPDLRPAQSLGNDALPKEGGEAEIRRLKTELRSLGALRLLRHFSINEAIRQTKRLSGQPLYSSPPSWSVAKKRADKLIKLLHADLSSLIRLLSSAPKNVTRLSYDSGKLEYR